MALRAFSRCPNEVGGRLLGFNRRAGTIDEKRSENKRKCDYDSQEDGTKRHAVKPSGVCSPAGRTAFHPQQDTGNCNRLANEPAPTTEDRAVNAPIAPVQRIGQRRSRGRRLQSHVEKLGLIGRHAGLDIAQRLAPGELGESHDAKPVSYTHLDVYKRQPYLRLHGVLAGAEKALDAKVLLDPFEQQGDILPINIIVPMKSRFTILFTRCARIGCR